MRIIISPAKKMNIDTDSLAARQLPVFIEQAEHLASVLKSMSYEELKNLWHCNDKIAALNVERLRNMELRRMLTPAILAYEGIQYQYMAPGVFTDEEFAYVENTCVYFPDFTGSCVLSTESLPIGWKCRRDWRWRGSAISMNFGERR